MLDAGVDCLTSGNHIWDKKEIIPIIDLMPQLLRPLNYPAAAARARAPTWARASARRFRWPP